MRQARLCALLLAPLALSCASYRYLPLPPAEPAGAPAPIGYQSTRFLVMHELGDDTLIDRIFTSPGGGATLLVTVLRPSSGVLSSTDGGASWAFAALPLDTRVSPRVLREVLFDATDKDHIYARAFNGLLVSSDRGRSWTQLPLGEKRSRPIDALAQGADGTLYIAQGDALYASSDRGLSAQPLPLTLPEVSMNGVKDAAGDEVRPDPVRIRSIAADPAHPKTVYVSIEPEPPAETFQRRLIGLLDSATAEGEQARGMLKIPADQPLEKIAFGDKRAGVYVTHDGGRSWLKSGLSLDAWLTPFGGAIYAVAAEPLVVAAGLARRAPELASAIGAQLHENGFEPELLRRACAYPGRNDLIAGIPAAPLFRSADQGATWSRLSAIEDHAAFALRRSFERQQAGRDPWPPRPFVHGPEQHDLHANIGPDQPNGKAPRNSRTGLRRREPDPELPPDLTAPLLSLLEPASLLSHLGPDVDLTGLSPADSPTLWAYAPTAPYWAQLADALVRATKRQGELSLGNGSELPADGPGFELLRSDDGGRTWTAQPTSIDKFGILAARGITPYPELVTSSAVQSFYMLYGHEKTGRVWRQILREDQPSPEGSR